MLYQDSVYTVPVKHTTLHTKLKIVYLNGKVNRQIDILLEVLLKIEHDQFFHYEMSIVVYSQTSNLLKLKMLTKEG